MLTVTVLVQPLFVTYLPNRHRTGRSGATGAHSELYADYLARMPRWWPQLRLWNEPGDRGALRRGVEEDVDC